MITNILSVVGAAFAISALVNMLFVGLNFQQIKQNQIVMSKGNRDEIYLGLVSHDSYKHKLKARRHMRWAGLCLGWSLTLNSLVIQRLDSPTFATASAVVACVTFVSALFITDRRGLLLDAALAISTVAGLANLLVLMGVL